MFTTFSPCDLWERYRKEIIYFHLLPFSISIEYENLFRFEWLQEFFLEINIQINIISYIEKLIDISCDKKGYLYFIDFLGIYRSFYIKGKSVSLLNILKKYLESIKDQIKYYNYHYYINNDSIITDFSYDFIFDRYKKLSNLLGYEEYIGINEIKESIPLIKVKHDIPLKTLSNSYSLEDVYNFHSDLLRRLYKKNIKEDLNYIIEPKVDGASIILKYEEGILKQALTRGNFLYGEDVTFNIKNLKDIPLEIDKDVNITLKGEVYCNKNQFEKINRELISNNQRVFANQRNMASGSLRLLDSKLFDFRELDVYVYDYLSSNQNFETDIEFLDFLRQSKFKTFSKSEISIIDLELIEKENLLKYFQSYYDEFKKNTNFMVPLDGIVLKVNSFFLREYLGSTNQKFNWAMAYKFSTERVNTKIMDIEFSIGRYGTITPIGILKPVHILGTVVKRVSLHNFAWVLQKDIRYNDDVIIEKAGEIIPYLVDVKKENRDKNLRKIEILKKCISCKKDIIIDGIFQLICLNCGKTGKLDYTFKAENFFQLSKLSCGLCDEILKQEIDSLHVYCPNHFYCKKQIVESIIHYVSRNAMNIPNIGKNTVELLVEKTLLKNYADLYSINFNDIVELSGMGEKSIESLSRNIEKSKKNSLYRLIYALGIRGVGPVVAKILTKNFNSLDSLRVAEVEDLTKIHQIDQILALNIYNFFRHNEVISIIEKLKKSSLNFKNSIQNTSLEKGVKDNFFKNKSFLITGTLKGYKREDIEEIIRNLGGIIKHIVSKNIDYCYIGESPGLKKIDKIKELNLKILSYDDLMKHLG